MSWLANRRVGTKLAANLAITVLGLVALTGLSLWIARDQILDDRRAKLQAVLEMVGGYAN